jgi:hypothetical protein
MGRVPEVQVGTAFSADLFTFNIVVAPTTYIFTVASYMGDPTGPAISTPICLPLGAGYMAKFTFPHACEIGNVFIVGKE